MKKTTTVIFSFFTDLTEIDTNYKTFLCTVIIPKFIITIENRCKVVVTSLKKR